MKRKLSRQITDRVMKDIAVHRKRRRIPLFNIMISVVVWLTIVALFYSGRLIRPQQLFLGQHAPQTVIATVNFEAETVDATELRRQEAADRVLPVFRIDSSGVTRARQALAKLVPRMNTLETATAPEQITLLKSSINDLLDLLAIPLSTDELILITPNSDTDFQKIVFDAMESDLRSGVISDTDQSTRFNGLVAGGKVTVRESGVEVIRELNSFIAKNDAVQKAVKKIVSQLPKENQNDEIVRRLITQWLQPNVIYDSSETTIRRNQARAQVEPVIEPVEGGTILVRAGDTITEQTLHWLTAHEKRRAELETMSERIQRLVGISLFLLIGLCITLSFGSIICPSTIYSRRDMLLMSTICTLPLAMAKLIFVFATAHMNMATLLVHFMMPMAMAPVLATVLIGRKAGLVAGFWTSFVMATLLGNSLYSFTSGLLVTVLVVNIARDVKRRTTIFKAGLVEGVAESGLALIFAIVIQPSWTILLPQLGSALLSGIASALFVVLLIPLFEHLFKITTDITLLELSDLSHPLLQSLAINAPGTYHHSLMMASIAQNAAETVGANGLLLRVCAYYHDIGKLVKPGFFTENIQFTENPHDELSPSMSTLVIISHVKEGITLAKKYRLPSVVIEGIRQHQGTALVSVFYHRAKTQLEKDGAGGQINEEDFRYEGPRPQTREMGILMLSDSCEAASRSLDKPTPVRIAGLVNDIFDSRLRDRQLDDCPLTLADLSKVKESIIFSLTNMLHGRIAYPKDENNRKEPSAKTPAEPAETPRADK